MPVVISNYFKLQPEAGRLGGLGAWGLGGLGAGRLGGWEAVPCGQEFITKLRADVEHTLQWQSLVSPE